jgi:hypothetical protein
VRKFLNSVTFQKMFNRASWPDLNFFALVEPHGDMLPVRAVYNDVEGESTNIGINPLTSKVPIWYSGPDLAASKIQTGRSPKIVKAVRITPVGVQEGLKPITLGNKKIVPEEDNFYNIVVEGKEQSSGPNHPSQNGNTQTPEETPSQTNLHYRRSLVDDDQMAHKT